MDYLADMIKRLKNIKTGPADYLILAGAVVNAAVIAAIVAYFLL
jgi:hypothetical protein